MVVPDTLAAIARDGTRLVADVWNSDLSPTLLLFPCGGEARSVFRQVVANLPGNVRSAWRIVAPDHRGHGDSGRSATYRFVQFLEDVHVWLDVLGASPAVVGGGSIGGALGLVAAGEGAPIDGVILLDVPTVPVLEKAQAEGRKVVAASERQHPAVRSVDPAFITSGFIEDVFRDPDRWRRAAVRLRAPTLLVGGERGVIGPQAPQLFREHMPHAAFVAADAGHLVARDAPTETARAIGRFLQSHWGDI